jgi:hypothetical protein
MDAGEPFQLRYSNRDAKERATGMFHRLYKNLFASFFKSRTGTLILVFIGGSTLFFTLMPQDKTFEMFGEDTHGTSLSWRERRLVATESELNDVWKLYYHAINYDDQFENAVYHITNPFAFNACVDIIDPKDVENRIAYLKESVKLDIAASIDKTRLNPLLDEESAFIKKLGGETKEESESPVVVPKENVESYLASTKNPPQWITFTKQPESFTISPEDFQPEMLLDRPKTIYWLPSEHDLESESALVESLSRAFYLSPIYLKVKEKDDPLGKCYNTTSYSSRLC